MLPERKKWMNPTGNYYSHKGIRGINTGFKNQIEKIVIIGVFQEKLLKKESKPAGTGLLSLLWTKYRKLCCITFLFVQD